MGITQSEFVINALERALGLTNPDVLLDEICSYTSMGDPNASENTSAKVKDLLRAKHSARCWAAGGAIRARRQASPSLSQSHQATGALL